MFSDYLTEHLGMPKDIGHELRYCCPFCGSNTDYKFYVKNNGSDKDGLWICFKCGMKGNPISFVMKFLGVGFNQAKDILAVYDYSIDDSIYDKVDTSLSPEEQLLMLISHMNDIKKVTEAVHEQLTCPLLPPGFKRIADNWTNPEIIPFLQYLNKRGFTTEDIIVHNIGYITYSKIETPSHKTLTLKNHVVFLTHNDLGQVIYWNTRAIGDSFVKSVNAPAKDHEYSKGTAVFNLNRAKRCKELVITEGVPDALTLGISGVGTFGKQITDEQIQLITEDLTEDQKIYIMLDEDAKDKIYWLAERIKPYHKNTYMVINPYKKDANDLGKELAWKVIHEHSVKADGTGELIRLLN